MWTHPMDTAGFTFAAGSKTNFKYGLIGVNWARWFNTDGEEGVKPPDKVIEISEQHKLGQTLPIAEANALAKEIYKYHADQAWALNTAGLLPSPAIIKNAMQTFPPTCRCSGPLERRTTAILRSGSTPTR